VNANRFNNFVFLSSLALTGCGNQSGDVGQSSKVEQGPWYEIGKAQAPGEPWTREILKEGTGAISTPGSAVFLTVVSEPAESMPENHKAEFVKENQRQVLLWLGTPPPEPTDYRSRPYFKIGNDQFRATLIGVPEGSKLRIAIPHRISGFDDLPLKGMSGFDRSSPETHLTYSLGKTPKLVEIHQVCEAKLYRGDGIVHEVGLKGHGERGFSWNRTWRAQWGKLEGRCGDKPFKQEIGPNSIEESETHWPQYNQK
jgi:hypothetical protein